MGTALANKPAASADRRELVMDIAVECGVALRRSAAGNGIVQAGDFLNGIAFAAVLLEKNLPVGDASGKSFREIFLEELTAHRADFGSGRYDKQIALVGPIYVGKADQSRGDMAFTVGASAENVMTQIAADYNLNRDEVLFVMAIVLFMIVWGNSGEKLEEALEELKKDVEAKLAAYYDLIPSDEEIFGEDGAEDLLQMRREK